MSLEQEVLERAKLWTQQPYDKETNAAVEALISSGGDELVDAFYKDLDFGTGGLRGVMGVGTNRVNKYTFGTEISNYICHSRKCIKSSHVLCIYWYISHIYMDKT